MAKETPLDMILVKNSTYSSTYRLKKKLLKAELIEDKCVTCGVSNEWNGKPLSLQLDHIDGDNSNNEISNLRVLCPNCHSQTDTYAGKKTKGQERVDKQREFFCKDCKVEVSQSRGNNLCRSCSQKRAQIHRRTIERPSHEELLKLVEEHGYRGTGKLYGVSDNAIRKWLKVM